MAELAEDDAVAREKVVLALLGMQLIDYRCLHPVGSASR
jgi:hypothetical protein